MHRSHIYACFYNIHTYIAIVSTGFIPTELTTNTNTDQTTGFPDSFNSSIVDWVVTPEPVENIPDEILQASNTLIELYQENATYKNLIGNISEICPEWAPCNVLRANEPGAECCLRCFCNDKCGKTRPCCPGFKTNKTETTSRSLQFEDIPKMCVESAFFTNISYIKFAEIDYEMITKCPDGTPDTIKDKCEAMFTKQEAGYVHAFVDIIPVTHTESLTNFANKHCAACHGRSREEYQNWGARVMCGNEILYDSESIERDVQRLDYCYLRIIPPTYEIGNATQCFADMRSQCNITGLWEFYDPKIEALCMEVDWLYGRPVSRVNPTNKRYKNILCAICNGETHIIEENKSICPLDVFGEINYNFVFVINYGAALERPIGRTSNSNTNVCPLGWMVDPLSMSCQEVVCSFPKLLNKLTMVCEDRFEQFTFDSAEIPFQFRLNSSSQTLGLTDLPQFHEYFKQAIEPLRKDQSCNYHSIFYKTATSYDSLDGEYYITGSIVDVISGILIAYADLGVPYYRTFETTLEEYLNSTLIVNGRLVKLEYNTAEVTYLPSAANSIQPNRTIVLDDILSGDIFSIYRDPFDGMAVLKVGEAFNVDQCVSKNLLYKKTYYDCPAFVYEMKSHGINYTANGIVLPRENVELNFGEFRSLNESHTAVCLNALEEKGLSVRNTLEVNGCADWVQRPIVVIIWIMTTIIGFQ